MQQGKRLSSARILVTIKNALCPAWLRENGHRVSKQERDFLLHAGAACLAFLYPTSSRMNSLFSTCHNWMLWTNVHLLVIPGIQLTSTISDTRHICGTTEENLVKSYWLKAQQTKRLRTDVTGLKLSFTIAILFYKTFTRCCIDDHMFRHYQAVSKSPTDNSIRSRL
jgi:hypothetical protein